MQLTQLKSFQQIREGDYFYTSFGPSARLELARIGAVQEDLFVAKYEYGSRIIRQEEIADVLVIIQNTEGLELLAGKNIFNTLNPSQQY